MAGRFAPGGSSRGRQIEWLVFVAAAAVGLALTLPHARAASRSGELWVWVGARIVLGCLAGPVVVFGFILGLSGLVAGGAWLAARLRARGRGPRGPKRVP